MKRKTVSALLVAAAGSMWGFMGLLVRRLGAMNLTSIDVCFVRALITAVFMFILLLCTDRGAFRVRLRDLWCFVGTGVISVTFFNFCYFRTIMLTSLSTAAVLLYTAPVFVVLMSAVLFKEKLTKGKLAAAALAFLGCGFVSGIVGGDVRLSLSGLLCGLGAGIGYAMYSIFSRYALERGYSSKTISFYTFVFALVPCFFLADRAAAFTALTSGAGSFAVTAAIVLFVTLLPYLSYTKGMEGLENGTASVIASVEPVVATLLGAVLYGERLSVQNLVGIALVLGSILLINLGGKPKVKSS